VLFALRIENNGNEACASVPKEENNSNGACAPVPRMENNGNEG
jgi:hypothetical protein